MDKSLTIKKLIIVDKWVELWFEEGKSIVASDPNCYHHSCKRYMLDEVIYKAGLEDDIIYLGYNHLIGMEVIWKGDRPIEILQKRKPKILH